MSTRFLIPVFVIAVLGVSWSTTLAGNGDAIAANSDLGRLQGRWTARAGARKEIQVTLTIQGRRVDVDIKALQGIRLRAQGEIKVDEKASPRQLDWINFSSADEQEFPQIPGIYKLDGDTFTVCNGGMHGARPREFKPGDGVLSEVVVFQRERVAAADKARPSGSATR